MHIIDIHKGFDSGEFVPTYNGFSPHYIGEFYGSSDVLGGEKKFKHCSGMFAGIVDFDFWYAEELNKLSESDTIELNNILDRNYNLNDYIKIRVPEIADTFNVKTCNVFRLGNRKILDLMLLIDQIKEESQVVEFCVEKNLKALDLIENCKLNDLVNDRLKQMAWKKYQKEQDAIEVVPSDINYDDLAAELWSIELGIAIPGDIDGKV